MSFDIVGNFAADLKETEYNIAQKYAI